MARINLLPWREEMRQEKKKEFLTQLGGICILVALVAFVWVRSVDGAIASQGARNAMLDQEIKGLEKQVEEIKNLKKERRELLDRMKVIQDLEGKRAIIVHYFDEMAGAVPDGVFLTSLKRKDDSFTLEGISESNNRISEFMRQIESSEWFKGTSIVSISADPDSGPQAQKFTLRLTATLPGAEENEDG
ncbi:MAG: PilN domain-containing protein [Agarilytica sp.]